MRESELPGRDPRRSFNSSLRSSFFTPHPPRITHPTLYSLSSENKKGLRDVSGEPRQRSGPTRAHSCDGWLSPSGTPETSKKRSISPLAAEKSAGVRLTHIHAHAFLPTHYSKTESGLFREIQRLQKPHAATSNGTAFRKSEKHANKTHLILLNVRKKKRKKKTARYKCTFPSPPSSSNGIRFTAILFNLFCQSVLIKIKTIQHHSICSYTACISMEIRT